MDQFIKMVYGNIFKGNVVDKEDNASKYFDQYGDKEDFICKAGESPIDEIEAEDLEETLHETKETASVLDQWSPSYLEIWSHEALRQLARLLNLLVNTFHLCIMLLMHLRKVIVVKATKTNK